MSFVLLLCYPTATSKSLWGHFTPVNNVATLGQQGQDGCHTIHNIPGSFKHGWQLMTRYAQCCIKVNRGYFVCLL
jgi:hypothetical protein